MRRPNFWTGLAGVLVGALLVSAVPVVSAATGDPITNGEMNWARRTTILRTSGQVAFRVHSNKGPALEMRAAAGHPPMRVNSSVRVTGLNADLLDGKDVTQVRPSVVWWSNDNLPDQSFVSAVQTVTVPPGGGTVVMVGSYGFYLGSAGPSWVEVDCEFSIDGNTLRETYRAARAEPAGRGFCSTNGARALGPGTYTVIFQQISWGTPSSWTGPVPIDYEGGSVQVMVIPNA